MHKSVRVILGFLLVVFVPHGAQAQWVQTNGPYGGTVPSIAVSGTTIYAGTYGAGVYQSTDDGANWAQRGLAGHVISALAFSGANLVAGGDASFVSTDNGATWTQTGLPGLTSLVAAGGYLYAGSFNLFTPNVPGVSLSTDDGITWNTVDTGLSNTAVQCLTFSSTLQAGSAVLLAGTFGGGAFISTNYGTSWSASNSGMAGPGSSLVNAFAVANRRFAPRVFFAGTDAGVFTSVDNAASWAPADTGLATNRSIFSFGTFGASVYAGTGGGVFQSTDYGATWISADSGLAGYGVKCFATDGANLLAGVTGGGVCVSTNSGSSWSSATLGMINTSVTCLAPAGGALLAVVSERQLFRSSDNGESWIDEQRIDSNLTVSAFTTIAPYLYALTNRGIYRSSDEGATWKQRNTGLTDTAVTSLISSNGVLYAGTPGRGLFQSTDDGATWLQTRLMASVYSLASTPLLLFAGSTEGALYFSYNSGASWVGSLVDSGTVHNVQTLLLSGTDLLAGVNGGGVFRSTDYAVTWTREATGLTTADASLLTSSGATIFAATDKGVFRSTNGGGAWSQMSDGLTDSSTQVLAIGDSNLYLGTNYSGVWRRPLAQAVSSVPVPSTARPERFALYQNYPNPFNPSTTIRYAIPNRVRVSLTVFNVLGQQLAILVNADEEPGDHSVRFDGSGLASGVYFYRLIAGTFVQARKLVLIR